VNRVKRLVDLGSPLQQPLPVRLERFPMTRRIVIDEVYDSLHAHCFPLASVCISKLIITYLMHHQLHGMSTTWSIFQAGYF
jgi:hypothetical protein